jgi:hypothetical protein
MSRNHLISAKPDNRYLLYYNAITTPERGTKIAPRSLVSKRQLFLNELKKQYDKEFELKNTQENKANYLLAASGIVVTLLFSYGSPIIAKLSQHSQLLLSADILLIISVSANVLTILFSVLAFKIQQYRYSMPSDAFYNDDGTLDDETIAQYRDGNDIDVFGDTMIDNYIRCNRSNGFTNKGKVLLRR